MRSSLVFAAAVVSLAACESNGHGHLTLIDAFRAPDSGIGDDAPPDSDPGATVVTTATWAFEGVSGTGSTTITPHQCPVTADNFDTAAIIAQAAEADGTVTGTCDATSSSTATCVVDLWNCTDYTGTQELAVGHYRQLVSITNHDGTAVYADTLPQLANRQTDGPLETVIVDNGGYIAAQWTLQHAGSTIACSAVPGATSVKLAVPGAVPVELACDAGTGAYNFTAPIATGQVTPAVTLVDSQGATLGTAPATAYGVTAPDHITLATYVIDVP